MGPREREDEITPHTRPPADDDADHLLVRTVRCLEGTVEIELVCEPVFDYGRTPAEWTLVDGSRHTADASGAGQTIRLQTDLALGVEGDRVRARHVLSAGDECYCALSWAEGLAAPGDVADASRRLDATTRFWRTWLGRARMPDHRWRDPIQRSALAIKGLTYMPTGATVAALTTSLPETPGGERNWDYRYTWMRDTTFTLQALHYLNLDWEADEFIQFVADLEPNPDGALQIMYGIDGRRDLTESTRDDLSGYAGARPVRIGNGAFDQRQNDVFGAVLDSILLHTRRSGRLPRRLWPIVQSQAECATAVWREPDQGIWEARGKPQHYVSSKLMGWVALDRAVETGRRSAATQILSRPGGPPPMRSRPTSSSMASTSGASCVSTTTRTRWTPPRCWPPSSDSCPTTTSGSAPACSPSPTSSPNTASCCATAPTRPTTACPARRGPSSSAPSGSCPRWRSSARTSGRVDLMEKLLRIASPLGLFAEEFDVDTGRHLGNFPQAFSHLALIEAAARIIVAERLQEFS